MSELIVVGVDGSRNADAALCWALTYARRIDATVRLVTAWGWEHVVGVPGARFPTETLEQAEARAHGVIAAALERMDPGLVEGVKVERRIARVRGHGFCSTPQSTRTCWSSAAAVWAGSGDCCSDRSASRSCSTRRARRS